MSNSKSSVNCACLPQTTPLFDGIAHPPAALRRQTLSSTLFLEYHCGNQSLPDPD
jgi:hypothetical protein